MVDWLTILPPIVAIVLVLWKREVIMALLVALFTSELLMLFSQSQALWIAPLQTLEQVASVFTDIGNTRILIFSLLIGALLALMRESGGVSATVERLLQMGIVKTPRHAGLVSFFTGVLVFIESNLSVLTAGILSRGLFDRFNLSRAKLAYIIDSTSAPICILIMLNAWGAFVLGLLNSYELELSSVEILIGTIPLNFYPLLTIALVFYTLWTGKTYGPMASSNSLVAYEAPVIDDSDDSPQGKARFMLIPLITMVASMVGFMLYTGNGNFVDGSGSKSALYATGLATMIAYLMMLKQGHYNHKSLVDISFKGMGELLPLVTIVLMSLALGSSLRTLGTGDFIAGIVADSLPLFLIPAVTFIAGALISFTTGTSWGTFAILIPIGMPLIQAFGLSPSLVIAAILGGGIFGDHCSPISDTTAVSSLASGCDLLEHVRTQLPYALVCGGLTIAGYVIAGLVAIG